MEDVTRVEWREWGVEAFEEALERDVPVLLSLTATWCDHCHEMDAETYAVPTIAANVNDGFVPIRVDVDRHPRVRDRYNMGGFPSTVFLSTDGSLLSGAGYLGQDGLRQVLESVRTMWDSKGTEAGRIPRPLREETPPAGSLEPDIERQMLGQLTETYDEVAGGWGASPKFPLPDTLEFALKRDRQMARRCFDAVGTNLLDEYEGGFYRFASNADWSGIQHEKLLDSNAALVRAFANAYLYTGRTEYLEPAERALEYLTTTLWTTADTVGYGNVGDSDETERTAGAFANSQAPGDPSTYTLDASDREAAEKPPIDRTFFAGSNALAVDALCTYYAYTDDERASRYAERALTFVRERLLEEGVVSHYDDSASNGSGGTGNRGTGVGGEQCLLANQARVLQALITAHSVLGTDTLEEATTVADVTIGRLRDGGSFIDGPISDAGLLGRPLRPLNQNVELADALLDLAILTGEDHYREVARETLEAFAGASDRFGVQVARYASVTARLLEEPLVIRVATPVGSDLHRAACRIADHEKVIVPRADEREDAREGRRSLESGTARAERGDRYTDPATTPAALSEQISSLLE